MNWLTVLLLTANLAISIGGAISLKFALQTANPTLAAFGAGLWAMSSVTFLALARSHDIGTLAIVLQALGLVASIAAGVTVFDETMTRQKFIGAILVISGVIAAAWPSGPA